MYRHKNVFSDNVTLVDNLENTVVQATLNEMLVNKYFVIKGGCEISPSFIIHYFCFF